MRAVAAVTCVGLIGYLFWRDLRKPDRDSISWMPFVWMFIAGSRFVSRWLNLQAPADLLDAYAEGNSVDRAVFLLLILWGSVVLGRRNIRWRQLLASNKWVVAYFLYCLVSMAWSSEPTILAKRWVKDLGNPIVALVLLSERRPYEATVVTLRRLAFVWLPLSILFIRYFPELGRSITVGGALNFAGVADQKNTLGLSCLVVAIGSAWRLLLDRASADRYDWLIGAMLAWLLSFSNSKTSLACLAIALVILIYAARDSVAKRPTRLIGATILGAGLYVAGDSIFGLRDYVLSALNRDPSLTNRTEVWDVLLSFQTNSIVGAGFMSFWTGSRMAAIWNAIGGPINQAHSGYLEQYLNLGYVGVAFIGAIALTTIVKARHHLSIDYSAGVLRFCLVVIALLYNYTEASFYGTNNMWVLFLAASIEPPQMQSNAVSAPKAEPRGSNLRDRLKTRGPKRNVTARLRVQSPGSPRAVRELRRARVRKTT